MNVTSSCPARGAIGSLVVHKKIVYKESLDVRSTNVTGRLKARVNQLQIAPPPSDELHGRAHSAVEQTVLGCLKDAFSYRSGREAAGRAGGTSRSAMTDSLQPNSLK